MRRLRQRLTHSGNTTGWQAWLWCALAVILCFTLAGGWGHIMGGSLESYHRQGRIRIGYAVEPPYAFLTPGTVTGAAPETAKVIVARLGIGRIEWRQGDFAALIDMLEAEEIDVIAAGMFITPERSRRVAFSLPTATVLPGLLVRTTNPKRLHSYQDLIRGEARLAVLAGAVEGDELRAAGMPEARLMRVPDAHAGEMAVLAGEADALALSLPTVRWMAEHNAPGQLEVAEPFSVAPLKPEAVGGRTAFAFRRSEPGLVKAWNHELAAFLRSADYGKLANRFGFGTNLGGRL